MEGKLVRFLLAAFWIFLLPCAASANDTAASVGAGGLVIEKNDNIEMVSELLEISTSKVRVTYHFMNKSDKDIKTIVAFPMPAFAQSIKENIGPLNTFQMYVNGKKVGVQKNRKFLIGNVDVADKFRKIGLTDDQIFNPNFDCMDGGPAENPCGLTEKQMTALHDMEKNSTGPWEIQETAYWEQTFPAGKDITVVHEYKPFTGFNDTRSDPKGNGCVDAGTEKLLAKRSAESGGAFGGLGEVKYILGTGRNWRGPIKHFKLVIKKDDPEDVVSLCFPGKPMKTSPTTIEFTQSDYSPQDMLDIFFYHYD